MTRFKTREKYCAVMVSGWGTEDTAQRRRLDRALGLAEATAGLPMWEHVCKEGGQLFFEWRRCNVVQIKT